jgi:hypothetical protein
LRVLKFKTTPMNWIEPRKAAHRKPVPIDPAGHGLVLRVWSTADGPQQNAEEADHAIRGGTVPAAGKAIS